jgi:beta-glucosidase
MRGNEVSQDELNEHVHRILRTIFASGLFDHPVTKQVPDVEKGYALAQSLADKSIALHKNRDNILPIAEGVHSVVVIGGHADSGVLTGGGSAQVDAPGGSAEPPPPAGSSPLPRFVRQQWLRSSPLKALVTALPGASITFNSGEDAGAAASAAKHADVAIVFAWQWESEGFDLPTLDLPKEQNELIEAVVTANPKTVVVLETGSPVTMPWIDNVAGVVELWYPGIRGAEALANILTGKVNPAGKSDDDLQNPKLVLPPPESQMIFGAAPGGDISSMMARRAKGLPHFRVYYDEGLKVGYKWYDAEKKAALFPFGFGLSYIIYAYSGLSVKAGDGLSISFKIKNTGQRAGSEIAQVYAGFPETAGEPPKRLIGWARVDLAPGEEKQVTVSADRSHLTVYDEGTDSWKLVPGNYNVQAGGSSRDLPLHQEVSVR